MGTSCIANAPYDTNAAYTTRACTPRLPPELCQVSADKRSLTLPHKLRTGAVAVMI